MRPLAALGLERWGVEKSVHAGFEIVRQFGFEIGRQVVDLESGGGVSALDEHFRGPLRRLGFSCRIDAAAVADGDVDEGRRGAVAGAPMRNKQHEVQAARAVGSGEMIRDLLAGRMAIHRIAGVFIEGESHLRRTIDGIASEHVAAEKLEQLRAANLSPLIGGLNPLARFGDQQFWKFEFHHVGGVCGGVSGEDGS